jgi:hypothetical protein
MAAPRPNNNSNYTTPDRYDEDAIFAIVRLLLIDSLDEPLTGNFLDIFDQKFPTLAFRDFVAAIHLTTRIARRTGLSGYSCGACHD